MNKLVIMILKQIMNNLVIMNLKQVIINLVKNKLNRVIINLKLVIVYSLEMVDKLSYKIKLYKSYINNKIMFINDFIVKLFYSHKLLDNVKYAYIIPFILNKMGSDIGGVF
nr:hypothetical protein [Grifola frondosa]